MLSLYDVRKPGILQGDPQARAKDWPNDEGRGGGVIFRTRLCLRQQMVASFLAKTPDGETNMSPGVASIAPNSATI